MDPPWPSADTNRPPKRKARSPSPPPYAQPSQGSSGAQMSSTYLPPIREMQSFLPSPVLHHQHLPGPPYQHTQSAGFSLGPSGSVRFPSTRVESSLPAAGYFNTGIVDSEPDADTESSRPKQKRRRQALSCTECKRRKIKCDRQHPCGPCARRNDQHKCQWHVVEPIDKYVTRAEFDDLKIRFDTLEAMVLRIQPSIIVPSTSGHAALSAGLPSASGSSLDYMEPHHSTLPFHNPTLGPSRRDGLASLRRPTEQLKSALPPLTAPSQTAPQTSSQPQSRAPPGQLSPNSPVILRSFEAQHSPSMRIGGTIFGSGGDRASDTRARPSGAAKSSRLSLSAITAPFDTPVAPPLTQDHPKNSYAQTFTPLGERLCARTAQGPAASPPSHIHMHIPVPTLHLRFLDHPTRHRRRARSRHLMNTATKGVIGSTLGRYRECLATGSTVQIDEHPESITTASVVMSEKVDAPTSSSNDTGVNSKDNLGSGPKAIIKSIDMSEDMRQESVDIALEALEKYNIEKDIAGQIKKEFDKRHGPTWHVVVGKNFGSYVTHETKHFIYFYVGSLAILIWKS
ncbi:hypothetical protein EW146_g1435 [Bondarzewia mesenterica]|uniref:Zn(2)-C6 fungal-type domain-containing protein n=1 Tax=Bondarzewia mesenterica TaxID=1095465 RepID=A0A4S4M645_9AGAM|nr:hypothetical protein EW146_g1435 [Bondarzewia mesenterica]